jgi:glycosyltransferase involved in cell wall biosynthesis
MQLKNQLTVSVIIPSFNHAQYVSEAIESVLTQTYKEIEIIVVDDGSIDNTKEVLAPYIKEERIRYIYQENHGLAAARNKGLEAAQGRYIKFLDSDDLLYPQQIEGQVDQIKTGDNFFSISDYCLLRPRGEIANFQYQPTEEGRQLAAFFEANQAPVHAYLVPKDLIQKAGGFDVNLKTCEDWDLWIRILQEGAVIKHFPYMGCCYRILMTSMSADAEKMLLQKCKIFEKINAWLLKEENLSRYSTKWQWFVSAQLTNNRLFDECIARGITIENILPNTIRMTDWLFRKQIRGGGKAGHILIGTKNYIRLRYYLRIISQRDYKFNLINQSVLWRMGTVSRKETL